MTRLTSVLILSVGLSGLSTPTIERPHSKSPASAKPAARRIAARVQPAFQTIPKSYLIAAFDLHLGGRQVYIDPFGKQIPAIPSTPAQVVPVKPPVPPSGPQSTAPPPPSVTVMRGSDLTTTPALAQGK